MDAPTAPRRCLNSVLCTDSNGMLRQRFFDDDGYDTWGRTITGDYDPARATNPSTNPFPHPVKDPTMEPVTVYSAPGCPSCNQTMKKLTQNGIEFITVDVSADTVAYDYIKNTLGYLEVPVVETNGEHWSGYRPDKIKALTA